MNCDTERVTTTISKICDCNAKTITWNTYKRINLSKLKLDIISTNIEDAACSVCGYGETVFILANLLDNDEDMGCIVVADWCGCLSYSEDISIGYYTKRYRAVEMYETLIKEQKARNEKNKL